MSFLIAGAVVGVGAGVAKAISGAKQKKRARAAEQAAKAEMEMQKDRFSKLDTSNPYENMENTMQDLTVNTAEADFMRQQQSLVSLTFVLHIYHQQMYALKESV